MSRKTGYARRYIVSLNIYIYFFKINDNFEDTVQTNYSAIYWNQFFWTFLGLNLVEFVCFFSSFNRFENSFVSFHKKWKDKLWREWERNKEKSTLPNIRLKESRPRINVYLVSTASLLCQGWRTCASNRCHRPQVSWKVPFLYSRTSSENYEENIIIKVSTKDIPSCSAILFQLNRKKCTSRKS